MPLLADSDPTTLSYWLTWRVLLCALWVLTPLVLGSYLIWKYEHFESDGHGERASNESYYNQSWKPCLKGIRPIFFMSFRIIASCLLLVALSFHVAVHGLELFYYYTHWTFSLCVIYFGVWFVFGQFLRAWLLNVAIGTTLYGYQFMQTASTSGMMTAGTLTDIVYWCVIFPFLSIRDYETSVRFPWFRVSYFPLWTGIYVIFQWIVHAFVSIW